MTPVVKMYLPLVDVRRLWRFIICGKEIIKEIRGTMNQVAKCIETIWKPCHAVAFSLPCGQLPWNWQHPLNVTAPFALIDFINMCVFNKKRNLWLIRKRQHKRIYGNRSQDSVGWRQRNWRVKRLIMWCYEYMWKHVAMEYLPWQQGQSQLT